ncbi:MAG: cupin-like domain-containing protein [Burkholderiaceae bacterium]
MLSCFGSGVDSQRLDREAFKFQHTLLGHPSLTLENLARVIPALPSDKVTYSQSLLKNGDDFERTFSKPPKDRLIEEVIENIRISNSYIMVNSLELHSSFFDLRKQLIADVQALMQERGVGSVALDPRLFLFIASPNSVTPFHIDRYSTFLMQFRGSKQVCVFAPWDERVVSAENREAYVANRNTQLPWRAETDTLSTKFDFSPGEALHIPFVAGHHVRNGGDDVSISMSIIFNTRESMAWRGALNFNYRLRRVLSRVGIAPAPVGQSLLRDAAKSHMWAVASRTSRALKTVRG